MAVLGVSTVSTTTGAETSALYRMSLRKARSWDDESSHIEVLAKGMAEAQFLDHETLLFVNGTEFCTLDAHGPASQVGVPLLSLPVPPKFVKVQRAHHRATVVFAAKVFEDGNLDKVNEHAKSERAELWQRVKVYDSLFIRHWDDWSDPMQRMQLFAVDLERTKGQWAVRGRPRNLLQGTSLECPATPLSDASDFDVSKHWVAFTAKDADVSQGWHTRQHIFLVPLDGSAEPRRISVTQGRGWAGAPAISPDEDVVVFLQQHQDGYDSGPKTFQTYSLKTGTQQDMLADWDLSAESIKFAHNGTVLYASMVEDEHRPLYAISVHGAQLSDPRMIVKAGAAQGMAPLRDGRLLYMQSTMLHPEDVFLYDGKSTRLTNVLSWSDEHRDLQLSATPDRFTFRGTDNVTNYGWLMWPPTVPKHEKLPLVVFVHGGPESDWGNSWSTRWNPAVFAASGFAVAMIDPSGSTGFGKKYTERILGHWHTRGVHDVLLGVRHLLEHTPRLDRDRVVAAGGSFGGYLINMLQSHNDDGLFKAFVTHDGTFNLISGMYGTDEPSVGEAQFNMRLGGDLSVLDEASPHRAIAQWRTPHLIVHGGKDYRVDKVEAIQAFQALQRLGVPSRFLYFPEENHWVLDPRNSLQWHNVVLGWLHEWSAPPPPARLVIQ